MYLNTSNLFLIFKYIINLTLILFLLFLPISPTLSNIFLGINFVFLLFILKKDEFTSNFFYSKVFVLSSLFFFSFTINCIDFTILLNRFFFILIPISVYLNSKLENNLTIYSFKIISLSTTFLSILYLFIYILSYFSTHLLYPPDFSNFFSYENTGDSILIYKNISANYFSFFCLTSILYFLFIQKTNKTLSYFFVFILLIFLIFLDSKLSFILAILSLLFYFVLNISNLLKKNKFYIILIFLPIVIFLSIFFKSNIFYSIKTELLWDLSSNISSRYNQSNISDSRVSRWKVIWNKAMQKPLFGHGLGYENTNLNQIFYNNELKSSALNRYNSHNQFLSFLLDNGFFSTVLFLAILILLIRCSFRSKSIGIILFSFSLIFFAFFENVYSRNIGMLFLNWLLYTIIINYEV